MASNSVFAELVRNCPLYGSNYTIWKRKIMFLLSAENIDYVATLDQPNEPADDATDQEKAEYDEELKLWTKDNKKARIFILGSMTDSLAGEYETENTACIIMRKLEEDFGEVSLIKLLSLVNRFLTSKMKESTYVNEHLNKFCVLGEELKNAGYGFKEEIQVMVALNSLPHSWEQFKISFCHSERTLNMRTLRHHLLMEENRKQNQGKERSSHHSELHLGEDRNRNWNKKRKGGDLRDKLNKRRNREDATNSFNKKLDKKDYKCHNCGDYGHFRADCTKRRKSNEQKSTSNRDKRQDDRKGNSSSDATGLY